MKCTNCGVEIVDGTKVCSNCGAQVEQNTQQQVGNVSNNAKNNAGGVLGAIGSVLLVIMVVIYMIFRNGGNVEKYVLNESQKATKQYVYENFEVATDDIETEIIYNSDKDYIVVGRYKVNDNIKGSLVMHVYAVKKHATVFERVQTNEGSVDYDYDYSTHIEELKAKWALD